MASRAVIVPFDFFLIRIWLRRNIAVCSTLERGINFRDSYVLKCLPSSLVMPAAMSGVGRRRGGEGMPYGWTFQGDVLVGAGARVWWGGCLKVVKAVLTISDGG